MNTQQLQVLKADIQSNPLLWANDTQMLGNEEIAAYYNTVASPAYVIWKEDVNVDEVMRNGMDWTRVDNLSVGKARIWDWMTKPGSFNAAKANIRAGIDATWVGTTADLAVRANVYTHCKRNATRVEKLFATGTGTTNDPAVTSLYGYRVTPEDVVNAIYA